MWTVFLKYSKYDKIIHCSYLTDNKIYCFTINSNEKAQNLQGGCLDYVHKAAASSLAGLCASHLDSKTLISKSI